jgi:hypothetical protein
MQTIIVTPKSNALERLAALCGVPDSSTTSTGKQLTIDEEFSSYIKAARSSNEFAKFWCTHQHVLPRLAKLVRRAAAVNCIIRDGLSFGSFRTPGMTGFLSILAPDYLALYLMASLARQCVTLNWSSVKERERKGTHENCVAIDKHRLSL